jgi:hypothetical protein
MQTIQLPEFTLLEKNNIGGQCDRCDHELKYVYVIRDNKTGKVGHYGSGCAQKVMGMPISEVVRQNEAYEEEVKRIEREKEFEAMGRTYVQAFEEANPEMLAFIAEGAEENAFLSDMKKTIEEKGSLTENQFHAVWRMMLPFAQFEKGEKVDLVVYPSKFSWSEGMYGWSYTAVCITENKEKVRVFFSSLNDQKERVLADAGVIRFDRGDLESISRIDMENPIRVTGTFDGYKIKRAKITPVVAEVA